MTTIAATFDNEVDLADALLRTAFKGIQKDNLRVMRDNPAVADPDMYPDRPNIPVTPSRERTALPAIQITDDTLDDLDLSDQEKQFYVRTAEGHANVLFVKVNEARTAGIRSMLKDTNANRIDTFN